MRQFAILAMIGVASAINLRQTEKVTVSQDELKAIMEQAKTKFGESLGDAKFEDWVDACQAALSLPKDVCIAKVTLAKEREN